jgi:hypothetical protein
MKKVAIVIGFIFLLTGCMHKHAKYVESGVLRRDINKQAFLDVWGSPERTRVVTFRDEDESTSLGWNFGGGGGGGGLFKGKRSRSFEEWSYEKFGITLLFSGYGLVDWKTDKTTEEIKALAKKRSWQE